MRLRSVYRASAFFVMSLEPLEARRGHDRHPIAGLDASAQQRQAIRPHVGPELGRGAVDEPVAIVAEQQISLPSADDLPTRFTIGLLVVVAGTLGDLVESQLKRSLAIKDSGSSIPGHGGFLDRFDGLLISAPFIAAFLKLVAF